MHSSVLIPAVRRVLSGALLLCTALAAIAADNFSGRWALTLPDGEAGWLEIHPEKGWYDGSILWGSGSVLPLSSVVISDGTLTVTRTRDVVRKDKAGAVVRTQQFTEMITAQVQGDALKLVRVAPHTSGAGFERAEFAGQRIPALPPAPDLKKVHYGEPIVLFDGKSRAGWRLVDPAVADGWSVQDGILVSRPVRTEADPHKRYGNLRTEREFEDFNLKLEVNVPKESNSGVFLRGIYEVQVFDSYGKPLDSHNMGAVYSRITPSVAAEKPPGTWQTFDITLLDRHVTVVLNGTTIIDNQPLAGCTGGALWSDESRPGPIFLQGDHGPVDYRNIVLRPILK